jgi:hypothetical protein
MLPGLRPAELKDRKKNLLSFFFFVKFDSQYYNGHIRFKIGDYLDFLEGDRFYEKSILKLF